MSDKNMHVPIDEPFIVKGGYRTLKLVGQTHPYRTNLQDFPLLIHFYDHDGKYEEFLTALEKAIAQCREAKKEIEATRKG